MVYSKKEKSRLEHISRSNVLFFGCLFRPCNTIRALTVTENEFTLIKSQIIEGKYIARVNVGK